MRHLLSVLIAFAAGVLLTLHGHASRASLASANSMSPAAAGTTTTPAAQSSIGDDWPQQGPTPEQVLYQQRDLVDQALAGLTARVAGRPNLYLVAFAGDGGEDVFRNEAEYAAQMFARRFGAGTHSVVLENNPDTLDNHPLASWSNLEQVLRGLSKVMKPDQDILMLYLTSHGGEDHDLLVDMDPLPLDQISATDLPGILAEQPFRWKVVVVNACYSGGFVPPLQGPGTLVITAARSDRSSFGCGSDSNITYFGKAWLVDALNRTPDFIAAFSQARGEISQWERQDKLAPSDPQIAIGSGIAAQLARWRDGFTPGPDLPFTPVVPAPGSGLAAQSR
jgi:hypothetical protein